MNNVTVMGRLGKDPEKRFTASGAQVTSFSVATNSRKKGEELTTWWRVTVWGDQFDRMLPHFKKGDAIIVLGELQAPEVYTDRNGNPQVSLEVTARQLHFSPFGKSPETAAAPQSSAPASNNNYNESNFEPVGASTQGAADFGSEGFSDDDLPF